MSNIHITYWFDGTTNGINKNIKPSERYIILFNTFNDVKKLSYSISKYDNLNEALDEINDLNELYKNHEKPVLVGYELVKQKIYYNKSYMKNIYDFSNNKSWWGYIFLDMKECICLKVGGDGFMFSNSHFHIVKTPKDINKSLEFKDYLFRDPNIVPDMYKWNDGEYEGWLQFKWGDGKNAINYVKPVKQKISKQKTEEDNSLSDDSNENYEDYEIDLIENKFADLLDKETKVKFMEKYGW